MTCYFEKYTTRNGIVSYSSAKLSADKNKEYSKKSVPEMIVSTYSESSAMKV